MYRILVTDNFHFMEEDEDVTLGPFPSAADATSKAQSIIDEFLVGEAKPGVSAAALLNQWVQFGETPIIHSTDPNASPVAFCATAYAQQRCAELTMTGAA